MVALSSLGGAGWQFLDANGNPLAGGKLYTYTAGTTTPATTYTSSTGGTPNANPIILDSAGRPAEEIWLANYSSYKFVLKSSANVTIWTKDNIPGIFADQVITAGMVEYDPPFTGALTTGYYLSTKLAQSVSVKDFGAVGDGVTSDQTAVQAAVTSCVSTGQMLYWPDGDYLTTANITGLHTVRHYGPGAIKRASNLFYVDPTRGQSNTIFVSASGSTSNDGLSSSQPMTIPTAWTTLANYGPSLSGKWNVSLAAGTYTGINSTYPIGLTSEYPVLIYGPDVGGSPNVPTAIIDGAGSSNIAIRARGSNSLYLKDIKFQNYYGSGGAGVVVSNGGFLATDNVHGYDNYDTIISYNGRLFVGGGIFELFTHAAPGEANYAAIRSMFSNLHTIGGVYNIDTGLAPYPGAGLGPLIKAPSTRTSRGILVQENATGHVECCTFENLSTAVNVVSNSRVHSARNAFKTCSSCYEVEYNSNVFDNPNAGNTNSYYPATANANLQVFRLYDSSTETSSYASTINPFITDTVFSPSPGTLNGPQTDGVLNTLSSYLQGYEFARFGLLRMRVIGTLTGTSGTKTIKMRVGGHMTSTISFASTATGKFVAELNMVMSGSNAQQNYSWGVTDGANTTVSGVGESNNSTTTVTVDDGTAQDVTLVTDLVAGDSITIHYIEMYRGGS